MLYSFGNSFGQTNSEFEELIERCYSSVSDSTIGDIFQSLQGKHTYQINKLNQIPKVLIRRIETELRTKFKLVTPSRQFNKSSTSNRGKTCRRLMFGFQLGENWIIAYEKGAGLFYSQQLVYARIKEGEILELISFSGILLFFVDKITSTGVEGAYKKLKTDPKVLRNLLPMFTLEEGHLFWNPF